MKHGTSVLEFFEHFPYAGEANIEQTNRLCGFGTAGETIALSFDVRADSEINELELAPLPLSSNSDVLAANCVQLYVVHVWSQAGVGVYQSSPMQVRELLLKDDRKELKDGYSRRYKYWRHLYQPYRVYRGPDIPLRGNVKTTLVRGKSKQIWVSVTIPHDCSAGKYVGALQIVADGQIVQRAIELAVDVLPIDLDRPEQDLLLWYRGKLDWRDSQHFVPEEIYRAQLQDIFDHGFSSISLCEPDRQYAQRAIEIAEAVGFKRNLVFMPPFPGDPDTLKYKAVTPVLYVSDEIDVHLAYPQTDKPEDKIAHHKTDWNRAKLWRMQSMSSLFNQSFTKRFLNEEDIGHCPDIFSYFLSNNQEFFYLNSHLSAKRSQKIYYYWHAHMEKPNLHRVLAGVYLWKTGVDGIAPYCYQHLPKYPNSPFDDADEWEPNFHVGAVRKPFRDHMLTYPAKSGSIPTLQWEGFREGILDLRYLTTLENLMKRAATASIEHSALSGIRSRLNQFLSRVDLRSVNVNSDSELEPYDQVSAQEYHEFRRLNSQDIMLLIKLLEAKESVPS